MIDLANKSWCIFGLRGSGKSWLLESILDSTPDHWVYDPTDDLKGYRRYIPTKRDSIAELSGFITKIIIPKKPALFAIDEANKYIVPKPTPLPAGISDLNDLARKWMISCGYVARRPVQFHTDIVELSNYVFFFHLPGKNDYAYMEGLHQGLGDAVRALKSFQFVVLKEGQTYEVHDPIPKPTHAVHTKR